jgi:D-alanine-D-alanine ligase
MTQSTSKIHVIVVFGGQSDEHDVSLVSATHVIRALDPVKYDVSAFGISREGRWYDATKLLTQPKPSTDGQLGVFKTAELVVDGTPIDALMSFSADSTTPTVVFPVLHGPHGEDGTVQGLLELAGVPYVGSKVLGSALAMDKAMAKQVLAGAGIAQTPFAVIRQHDYSYSRACQIADDLGYPVFVKPSNLGSSIGITKVHERSELEDAIAIAFGHDRKIVLEHGVVAREIEVAVLGNNQPRASIAGEIVPSREFYDYEDKYVVDGAQLLVPAPLTAEQSDRVRSLALSVFETLGLAGMARVDFLYDEAADVFLCNEANTIPGFTPISMYPRLWQQSGLTYGGLLDELIALALE